MKTLHKFLGAAVAVAALLPALASAQNSATYPGNGAGGFGGSLGQSTLSVSDNAATGVISFSLALGNGNTGFNDIGFYIDSTSGGVTSTANLNDTGDEGRRTLSGNSTTTSRALVNFASGFGADYGVALDANGNANLFRLDTGASITFISGANSTHAANSNVYGFSIHESDIGLTAGSSFNFVASLLNANDGNNGGVYRSNETIGTANVDNSSPNLGQGTLTYTSFDTFVTAVPEPATWLAGGLLVFAAGVTTARKRRSVA